MVIISVILRLFIGLFPGIVNNSVGQRSLGKFGWQKEAKKQSLTQFRLIINRRVISRSIVFDRILTYFDWQTLEDSRFQRWTYCQCYQHVGARLLSAKIIWHWTYVSRTFTRKFNGITKVTFVPYAIICCNFATTWRNLNKSCEQHKVLKNTYEKVAIRSWWNRHHLYKIQSGLYKSSI